MEVGKELLGACFKRTRNATTLSSLQLLKSLLMRRLGSLGRELRGDKYMKMTCEQSARRLETQYVVYVPVITWIG
jgi:hypothetical protein